MEDSKITLNGKEITPEQLNEEKKKLQEKKDIKLVEVSPNNFVTRLLG